MAQLCIDFQFVIKVIPVLSTRKLDNVERSVIACSACYLLHATSLLGFLFEPDGGGDMFFRNVV
jgi:hypothetical protein